MRVQWKTVFFFSFLFFVCELFLLHGVVGRGGGGGVLGWGHGLGCYEMKEA